MYNKPTLATFYRLRMIPLQKGKFLVHNHVSWLFGLEIRMIENEIRGNLQNLEPLEPLEPPEPPEPPVDCSHE